MMKLACKDMDPTIDCAFEATGESAPEVAGKMMGHVKTDHPEVLAGKSPAEVMENFKSKVHE